MMAFEYVQYIPSSHAVSRWCSDRIQPSTPISDAYRIIGDIVKSGEVLLDVGRHRYVKKDNLFFPCVRLNKFMYRIKSVLTWDMVEHRMDKIIQKYSKE